MIVKLLLTQSAINSQSSIHTELEEADAHCPMSWENLIYVTDFLLSQSINDIIVPLENLQHHPLADAYIKYLLIRKMNVTLWCEKPLNTLPHSLSFFLSDTDSESISVIARYDCHSYNAASITREFDEFITKIARFLTLSINVDSDINIYGKIISFIEHFNIRRNVLIQPPHKKVYLNQEKYCPSTTYIDNFFNHLNLFESKQIKISMDNGFSLTHFSDNQLGRLFRHNASGMKFGNDDTLTIGSDLSILNPATYTSTGFSLLEFYDIQSVKQILSEL